MKYVIWAKLACPALYFIIIFFLLVTQSILPVQQTFTRQEELRDRSCRNSRLWHPKETKTCHPLYLCRFRIVVTSVVILILAILWRYQESDNVRLVMDSVTGHVTIIRDRVISLGTPLQNFMQKIYQRGKSWHTQMILYSDLFVQVPERFKRARMATPRNSRLSFCVIAGSISNIKNIISNF